MNMKVVICTIVAVLINILVCSADEGLRGLLTGNKSNLLAWAVLLTVILFLLYYLGSRQHFLICASLIILVAVLVLFFMFYLSHSTSSIGSLKLNTSDKADEIF